MNEMNGNRAPQRGEASVPTVLHHTTSLRAAQTPPARAHDARSQLRPARARWPAFLTGSRGKGWGSQLSPAAPPLAPSGHRTCASAETPLGLGVPSSAETLPPWAAEETVSTGKAKGATVYAWPWSPRRLFRTSSYRFPSKERVSTSVESALRRGRRACAREPKWLLSTPAYEGRGGGSPRLRTEARRRPAPAQPGAAETVGLFASPRLARRRVRSLRRRRGRHRSG